MSEDNMNKNEETSALFVSTHLTGIMTAIVDRRLPSEIGFRGIFKIVFEPFAPLLNFKRG